MKMVCFCEKVHFRFLNTSSTNANQRFFKKRVAQADK